MCVFLGQPVARLPERWFCKRSCAAWLRKGCSLSHQSGCLHCLLQVHGEYTEISFISFSAWRGCQLKWTSRCLEVCECVLGFLAIEQSMHLTLFLAQAMRTDEHCTVTNQWPKPGTVIKHTNRSAFMAILTQGTDPKPL